jgi:hypothetical protein
MYILQVEVNAGTVSDKRLERDLEGLIIIA